MQKHDPVTHLLGFLGTQASLIYWCLRVECLGRNRDLLKPKLWFYCCVYSSGFRSQHPNFIGRFFFFNFAPLGDIFFLFTSQICICILRIVLNKLQTKAGIKASALNFNIKSHTIQSKHCFSGLFQVRLKSIYLVGKKGNPL